MLDLWSLEGTFGSEWHRKWPASSVFPAGLQGAGDGGWAQPDVVDGKDKELIYTLVVRVFKATPLRAPVVGT